MTINVVIFIATYDTGGQGFRIKRAFDRYQPDFVVRSVHAQDGYFAYPHDLRYEPATVSRLFEEADIVHMRNGLEGLARLRSAGEKPFGLLVHYHGTKFREEHVRYNTWAHTAGARQVASTLDLTLLEADVGWLPSPYDMSELAAYRQHPTPNPSQVIRFAHSPTNRMAKGTKEIMDATMELVHRGLPVTFDLIERKPWLECLRLKAKADIFVDQLSYGYGNNAIEAWGMGIPVISGVADPAIREAMIARWGGLPFYEADKFNLAEKMADLATDSDLRTHWGEIGRVHAAKYHDERIVAQQLSDIYRETIGGGN